MDTTKSENIIETNYTTIVNFNPPTPWGVGPAIRAKRHRSNTFQSTHSVGSGTDLLEPFGVVLGISIHPLRGEWDLLMGEMYVATCISIHPLRGEWD